MVATLAMVPAACGGDEEAADGSCTGLTVTIGGTSGDDRLRGTPGPDVLWGGPGNDRLEGLEGDDVLCGGPGADRLLGGEGHDLIDGGIDLRVTVDTESYEWEGDTLAGGPGDDTFVPGPAGDHQPVDEITYAAASSGVTVDLAAGRAIGDGADLIEGGVETLVGSSHADRLLGSGRAETIRGGRGPDRIDGRGGDDRLDAAGSPRVETTSHEGADRTANRLVGGPGDDELTGAEGDDLLDGGDGEDALYGELGTDRVHGGPGQDSVADYLAPVGSEVGRQLLDGGTGADRLGLLLLARPRPTGADAVFAAGASTGTVDLAAGWVRARAGTSRFDVEVRSFAHVELPWGTWTAFGTDGPNEIIAGDEKRAVTIHARGGDDRLAGSFVDDLLDGGAGHDVASGYVGRDRYVDVEKVVR